MRERGAMLVRGRETSTMPDMREPRVRKVRLLWDRVVRIVRRVR